MPAKSKSSQSARKSSGSSRGKDSSTRLLNGQRGGASLSGNKASVKGGKGGTTRNGPQKTSGSSRRKLGKRELINTGTDKRYVRRNNGGQFTESDDVGRSLSADRRRKATTKVKPGYGDRGDR